MELTEIVNKLVGDIRPIGESNHDEKSLESLKVMCELIDKLIFKVAVVAKGSDSYEASVKAHGEYAEKFISELKKSL